jgi:hypothetical protein
MAPAVVIIDLICGFPGQTMEMWRRDIKDFLTPERDGPLATERIQGQFPG